MQIKVATLRETLGLVTTVVPKKPTLPVLKYVLVKDGKLTATDLEAAVILDLPGSEEACLLPFDELSKLLKYVPAAEDLSIEKKRGSLKLSWSDGSASYEAINPEDYPPLPEFEPELQGTINGDELVSALSAAVSYCATDETRPVLNGVTLKFGEVAAEIFAGDGFRMSCQTLPLSLPGEATAIIPSKTVQLLAYLWEKTPRNGTAGTDSIVSLVTSKKKLEIALNGKLMKLQAGHATIITQLTQGTPPDWWRLVTKEKPAVELHVIASEFERAARRVSQVAEDGGGGVRLVADEANLVVSAKGEKQAVEVAVALISSQGGPGKVAINFRYLLDYLQGKEGVVSIGIHDVSKPVSFQHRSSPLVIIMPMSVQW